jgi:hypothetical protein
MRNVDSIPADQPKTTILRRLLIVLLVVVAVVLILAILGLVLLRASGFVDSGCKISELSRAFSPDKRHIAVYYARDCGASDGGSSHMTLLTFPDTIPKSRGNVAVEQMHCGMRAVWVSNRDLRVEISPCSRPVMHDSRVDGVRISFVPVDTMFRRE